MTTREILIEAKRLIEEKGWTQGVFARDSTGLFIDMTSGDACSYCAGGAICVAGWRANSNRAELALLGTIHPYVAYSAQLALLSAICPPGTYNALADIASWNDDPHRTKAEVLAAFDKAIERAT